MARPIIDVPPDLCRATGFDWDIDWRTQPTGEATDGTEGVLSVGFPRWIGTLALVLPPDLILQWRAVRAKARGRIGLYRVEIYDPLVPVPMDGKPWFNGEPWNNGEPWSGTPFWNFAQAQARGDSTVRLTVPAPMPDPVAGQIISHEEWPTRVTRAIYEDGAWTVEIDRPLIVAAASGDPICLRPIGIFEAVSDTSGNPSYDLDRVSKPTLELREYLRR